MTYAEDEFHVVVKLPPNPVTGREHWTVRRRYEPTPQHLRAWRDGVDSEALAAQVCAAENAVQACPRLCPMRAEYIRAMVALVQYESRVGSPRPKPESRPVQVRTKPKGVSRGKAPTRSRKLTTKGKRRAK